MGKAIQKEPKSDGNKNSLDCQNSAPPIPMPISAAGTTDNPTDPYKGWTFP
jgi:hypothetical protein